MNLQIKTDLIPVESSPTCRHCGLKILTKWGDNSNNSEFCCAGCRTVYQMINSCGLESYYKIKAEDEKGLVKAAHVAGADFTYFDDPAFLTKYTKSVTEKEARVMFICEDIHCSACLWLLERLNKVEPAISSVRVNFLEKIVTVNYDSKVAPLSKIATIMDSFGYPPKTIDSVGISAQKREDSKILVRLGVAAVCAGNVMMLAVSLYEGDFSADELILKEMFSWISAVLCAVSILFSASSIFRTAWTGLKNGIVHIDTPLALGVSIGFVVSLFNLVYGRGEIYFDSLAILIFLILLARFIQKKALDKVKLKSGLLNSLIPEAVLKWDPISRTSRSVFVDSVRGGDLVQVKAGQVVPVDGSIVSGSSHVNISVLTGESRPVSVIQGDRVFAGTKVMEADIIIKVETQGSETRIGKILREIELAPTEEHSYESSSDRIARMFVKGVFAAALFSVFYWWQAGPAVIFDHLLALFVVTCPCALGLSAPLTFANALYRAARLGIVVKSSNALERLGHISKIVFDKTGTITTGLMEVVEIYSRNGDGHLVASSDLSSLDSSIAGVVLALESESRHPIGESLRRFCLSRGAVADISIRDILPLEKGISGRDQYNNLWSVGAPKNLDESSQRIKNEISRKGLTPVVLSRNDKILCLFGLGDSLQSGVPELIQYLTRRGVKSYLLSGDDPVTVSHIGEMAGISSENIRGGCSPEQKVEFVSGLLGKGGVVMVGDGVNDAGAISAADVGIAVQGGVEASLKASDVYITEGSILKIKEVLVGSLAALRTLKMATRFSLVYNLLVASFAVFGTLTPLQAALLMPISSITVITISVKGRYF